MVLIPCLHDTIILLCIYFYLLFKNPSLLKKIFCKPDIYFFSRRVIIFKNVEGENIRTFNSKKKVALLSITSNSVLTIGKLGIGLMMNSISVISEAIHSGIDLLAAIIAYVSISISGQPADEKHLYGHGKFENVAAIIEALLIVGAGIFIIHQAIYRLTHPAPIHALDLGLVVMGGSAVANLFVSRVLLQTAKKTDSPALAADGWHLLTDVYTSAGVFAGIIIIYFTRLTILDPIIALAVTLLIFKAASDLLRESIKSIVDTRLSKEDEETICAVLQQHAFKFVQFHKLRTRKAGPERHVDLHLVVPYHQAINSVHEICDGIENDIRRSLPEVHVLIHAEPCEPARNDCQTCTFRQHVRSRGVIFNAPTGVKSNDLATETLKEQCRTIELDIDKEKAKI